MFSSPTTHQLNTALWALRKHKFYSRPRTQELFIGSKKSAPSLNDFPRCETQQIVRFENYPKLFFVQQFSHHKPPQPPPPIRSNRKCVKNWSICLSARRPVALNVIHWKIAPCLENSTTYPCSALMWITCMRIFAKKSWAKPRVLDQSFLASWCAIHNMWNICVATYQINNKKKIYLLLHYIKGDTRRIFFYFFFHFELEWTGVIAVNTSGK